MADELPADLQQQLVQLQNLTAQLQATAQQRLQFEALKAEARQAIEALEGAADDAPIYRSVGAFLVRDAGKAAAIARLKEEGETLDIRLKRVKSQEDALRASATALQQKLQGRLKG